MGNNTFCGIFPRETNICLTNRDQETPDPPKLQPLSPIKKGPGHHYMEDSLHKKMDETFQRPYSMSFAVEAEGEEKERNFSLGEFVLQQKWGKAVL